MLEDGSLLKVYHLSVGLGYVAELDIELDLVEVYVHGYFWPQKLHCVSRLLRRHDAVAPYGHEQDVGPPHCCKGLDELCVAHVVYCRAGDLNHVPHALTLAVDGLAASKFSDVVSLDRPYHKGPRLYRLANLDVPPEGRIEVASVASVVSLVAVGVKYVETRGLDYVYAERLAAVLHQHACVVF